MMTIKPSQAEGEPIEILRSEGPQYNCNIVISCEGHEHRITIKGSHATIHDHTSEDIESQQIEAELGTPDVASPCVRVQIWEQQGGFEIDPL